MIQLITKNINEHNFRKKIRKLSWQFFAQSSITVNNEIFMPALKSKVLKIISRNKYHINFLLLKYIKSQKHTTSTALCKTFQR